MTANRVHRRNRIVGVFVFLTAWLLVSWSGVLLAQAPARLIVRNAYIFSMAPQQHAPFRGYMVVAADGRLTAVAAGDPPAGLQAATVWDADGHWVIPGFISAHSHLWQSAYRGLASDQTLPGWLQALYGRQIADAGPEDFYWFTLEGGLDHLRHGITAAYSFNYGGDFGGHSGVPSEAFNEAAFRGEMDSGLRFVHGIDPGRASAAYTVDAAKVRLKTFLDWSAAQPAGTRLLSVMLNGGGGFSDNDQQLRLEEALMQQFHLGNQSHYLEQPETQVADRSHFVWFQQSGLLSHDLIFGHFVHTDAAILAATGQAGAAMSWNPLSNGRLASGVADIPAYLKAGVRVGMGVDGEASADLADPFENMRTGLYTIRAKYENAGVMSPYDVLRLHTLGSADVLGVADRLGSLEPGKLADFVVVDPTHFAHVFDPYATLVFVTSQPDVERVYVGGELMVERGEPLRRDLRQVEREVDRRVAAEASATGH